MKKIIFHDVEQNSEVWDSLRLGKATFSSYGTFMANYGKAFGEPAKEYALRIALERVTGMKADNGYTNEHMERGHEQEPIAKMLYADMHFVDVMNGGFYDCGEYGGSPDGRVGEKGRIEIKSVMPKAHYATMQRKAFDPAYKWQLVGNLDGTDGDWIDFISYCALFPVDKQLLVYRYDRDYFKDELPMLIERRAEFLVLVSDIEKQLRMRAA